MPAESASLADRRALADDLAAECERIAHENALLEAHLARVSPTDGAAPPEDPEDDDALRAKKPTGGAKKKSRASAAPDVRPRALTVLERHAIVNAELEALEHDLARSRTDGERRLGDLRARVEETDARIADAKRETFEFKRDVAVGAVDPRTGAVDADAFARHLRAAAKSRADDAEKYELKNATTRAGNRKLEASLRAKEEAGEDLSAIDFERLKIEHEQSSARLAEKNAELLRLKSVGAAASESLARVKAELEVASREADALHADMSAKRVMISSFDVVMAQVNEEHRAAAKRNKDLHTAGSSSENPPVMEYVRAKNNAQEWEARVREWERKLEMADMHLASQKLGASRSRR